MTNPINYSNQMPPNPYGGVPQAPQKPSSITAVAIFAIVMGALGSLCCGVGGVVGTMMGGEVRMPDGTILKQDSGVMAIGSIFGLLDLIASVTLLACGIGALSLKPWARQVGVIISAVILALAIARFVATLTYTGPKTEELMKQIDQQMAAAQAKQGANAPAAPSLAKFMSSATIGIGVVVLLLECFTPFMILLLWTRPHVKAWFGGGPGYLPPGGYPQ